jgi:CRISPR type IV-associated protein Csf2
MNPAFILADVLIHTVQPLTYTHHSVKDLPLMTRGVDAEGRPQRTVYLPAGQFRGRLRHEAAMSALRAKPEKVRLEDAYLLALGQDLARQEEDEPEAVRLGDQIKFRQDNPLLDLFGTWKVASRLFVSHLMPQVNVMPDRVSHIRRDLDSSEDLMGMLAGEEQDRMYDRQAKQALASKAGTLIKLAEGELRAARKAKDTALIDQLELKLKELEELKKQHKGEDDSDNTKHLVELQVIPAGIDLLGKITVQAPRQTDIGFLIQALQGVSMKPLMGAQRARGCGEIRGRASFRIPDGEVLANVEFGGFQPAKVEWTAAGQAFMGPVAA